MTASLWFACHIMDLVNRAIEYDRGGTEKAFLLDHPSPIGLAPSFKAASGHVALQQRHYSGSAH
jgi:hypothetical protein